MIVWKYLCKGFNAIDVPIHIGQKPPKEKCIEFWWGNPADWKWNSKRVGKRVGYCLSEVSSLPAENRDRAIENLKKCELIICTSEFSTRAYKELPLDMPIEVAWLGVDTDELHFVNRDWRKPLKFLLAGAAQFRKGTWIGIGAFVEFNKVCKDSSLTVWSSTNTPDRISYELEYVYHNDIIFDSVPRNSPMEVYKDHHILLSPHLSEGFGLTIPEAMSTGMPCMVSRVSSPREFFNSKYGWWIEMSDMYAPVSRCLENVSGVWKLPDRESLITDMKMAYDDREFCKNKGKFGSKFVRDNLTWEHTAKRIMDII